MNPLENLPDRLMKYAQEHQEVVVLSTLGIVLTILGLIAKSIFLASTLFNIGVIAGIIWGLSYIANIVAFLSKARNKNLFGGLGCIVSIAGYIGLIAAVALSFNSWTVALCTISIFIAIAYEIIKNVLKENKEKETTEESEEITTTPEIKPEDVSSKTTLVYVLNIILNVAVRFSPFIAYYFLTA